MYHSLCVHSPTKDVLVASKFWQFMQKLLYICVHFYVCTYIFSSFG